MRKILVLSPHMDDAVLSCCDYLLNKKNKKSEVKIITIFTNFKSEVITSDAKRYLKKSGHENIYDFEKERKKEDRNSLDFLGFKHEYWDFIDGGFRQFNKKNIYKNYNQLFSGRIHPKDKKIILKILEKLKKYKNDFDEILIPLGIGKHADHLIIKSCGEKVFNKNKINYYIDWPYAFKLKNWNLTQIFTILKNKKWITFTSKKKKKALQLYKSQVKLLFGKKPLFYPEIISNHDSRE
jgi:LmbE family N-acetylglucosaminyl deacetylase